MTVSPWEKSMVPVIEKAIYKSDLGLTPNTAGTLIRINMPALTEERRRDIIKVVKSEAENARVAVRGVRREVMNELKEMLKEKLIAQDDDRRAQDDVQKLTDKHVAEIDHAMADKEKELHAGVKMADSPQHVAIIMDGNGRWARSRGLPRPAGHRCQRQGGAQGRGGMRQAQGRVISPCSPSAARTGAARPTKSGMLMKLFLDALEREVADLHRNQVRLALHRRSGHAGRRTRAAHAGGGAADGGQLRIAADRRRGLWRPLGYRPGLPLAGRRRGSRSICRRRDR